MTPRREEAQTGLLVAVNRASVHPTRTAMIMGVLRDILDLFVIREESKKRRVETQLAEAKLAEQRQLITIATKEEVERYDPKVRHLTRRLHSSGILSLVLLLFHAHQALGWRRRRLLAWVALLLLVAAAVVIYHR